MLAMLSWRVPSRALTWWLSQQVGEGSSYACFSAESVLLIALCQGMYHLCSLLGYRVIWGCRAGGCLQQVQVCMQCTCQLYCSWVLRTRGGSAAQ